MLQAVRASPGVKAATLSRESQALTHAVRMQLDSQCMQGDAEVRGAACNELSLCNHCLPACSDDCGMAA